VSETILYLIAGVLILAVLRSIIGVVLKGAADFFATSSSPGSNPQSPNPQSPNPPGQGARTASIPTAEALKKDPVCGTYLAPSSAVQKTVGGVTHYFCSVECRDKFRAAAK
jgi:YHS domain-containing protein